MSNPIHDLAPADYCDPVIEAYKKDVDRTLLRENLKLTVDERTRKAIRFQESVCYEIVGTQIRRKEDRSLEEVLRLLTAREVRFVIIGDWAAIIHGSACPANDVDLVYARDAENIRRLVDALRPWNPRLRNGLPRLALPWDEATVHAGLNFPLTTDLAEVNLFGEVIGGGAYNRLLRYTEEMVLFGITCQVVTLERLIQLKRAAGHPEDLGIIADLQALLEERRKRESSS